MCSESCPQIQNETSGLEQPFTIKEPCPDGEVPISTCCRQTGCAAVIFYAHFSVNLSSV